MAWVVFEVIIFVSYSVSVGVFPSSRVVRESVSVCSVFVISETVSISVVPLASIESEFVRVVPVSVSVRVAPFGRVVRESVWS